MPCKFRRRIHAQLSIIEVIWPQHRSRFFTMALPQPVPSLHSLAGMDAKLAALAKLEALHEEIGDAQARQQSIEILRQGIEAWRRGDIVGAGQLAFAATEADANN